LKGEIMHDGINLEAANARLAQMGFAGGTSFETTMSEALDDLAIRHLGPAIDHRDAAQQTPPHGGPPMTLREVMEAESPTPKPARKRRSDAGVPKPTKPAAAPVQAVKLTREHVDKIRRLGDAVSSAVFTRDNAERVLAAAIHERDAYLDSLTA
jgi:hypothetical protein